MSSPEGGRAHAAGGVAVPAAALAAMAAFVLVPLLGGPLQAHLGAVGLALTEVVCVLLPVLVVLRATGATPDEALGLRRLSPRALVGAVLLALGAFYLAAAGVEGVQERLAPLPPALREQMREFIVPAMGPRPLLLDLLALALAPALCEEALFRGLLLQALSRSSRGLAVLVTALCFGAFHYSLYKFLPTAALGAFLGVAALRAESLQASIAVHAVNNTIVLLLVRAGRDEPPGAGSRWLLVWLCAAALVSWIGLRLLAPAARRTPRTGGARRAPG